ncbi:MAG: methionine--tRNA ligase subunit beta, partial [Clostridia bacterium]|nr:methionine--tRNA ligase subunit beta [Clostridia bacterium]
KDYDSLESFGALEPGITVGKAVPLFARIDKDEMFEKIEARQKANAEAETANNAKVKEELAGVATLAEISIDDFAKVELRVAEIKACEPIKRAKKLLKLTLDDGEGERTVASGIAPWYSPEDLTGHKVIIVANLKPAKLCGVESQGMILAADNAEDDVKVLFVDDLNTGAKIR